MRTSTGTGTVHRQQAKAMPGRLDGVAWTAIPLAPIRRRYPRIG